MKIMERMTKNDEYYKNLGNEGIEKNPCGFEES